MEPQCKNEFFPESAQSADGPVGSVVIIPCQLSNEISHGNMEIRWFKGTKCVCLYMDKEIIPGEGYRGRVGLNKDIEKGNVFLELNNVTGSDGGDYLCQVTSGDRTVKITVRLNLPLNSHENTEVLQKTIEKTAPEQTDEKKMEKSVLMAVFAELKDAKQESKKKDEKIEKLTAELLQTGPKKEERRELKKDTQQLENINKSAKDLETSKLGNPETKTTPQEKQPLNIDKRPTKDPVQVQGHVMSQKSKKDEGEYELMQTKLQSEPNETRDPELKEASKCLEKAKQESKEKDAKSEEPMANLLETDRETETENSGTQNLETKTTSLEKQQLDIDPVQVQDQVMSRNSNHRNQISQKSKTDEDEGESESVQTKRQRKTSEPSEPKEVKVFTFYTGNKKALHEVHKNLIGTLQNQIPNLREVKTVDESDFALILCPIISRAGTDIDAAVKQFKSNTGSKLAVLVVLHPTIDPEKTVLDSSKHIHRTDILTVDYLFSEDTGLLKCQRNSDADDKVQNWLIKQELRHHKMTSIKKGRMSLKLLGSGMSFRSKQDKSEYDPVKIKWPKWEDDKTRTKGVKVFNILAGKTNKCDKIFIAILEKRIENLRVVPTVDQSDVILVFCPIVSRAGTDIDAALNKLKCYSEHKPTVMVVLHHTFDPEKVVPNSSSCVSRTNILTVDILFYEDTGILDCQKNLDSTNKAVNWLIQQQEKKHKALRDTKYFVSVTGDAQGHHVHFIEALRKKMIFSRVVSTVQESDVILLFSPDISGCHRRTDRPVVLIFLHQTLDQDKSKRRAVIPVDYIFLEGGGQLDCKMNNDEISAVLHGLKENKGQASINNTGYPSPQVTSSHPVNYFTNLTGDTKKHFLCFIEATNNQICLNEVTSVEDSDVILLFCPDISDCNKGTDKPVVLISLHKTPSSDSVPNSNEFVNRRDILPLDLVLAEDKGLSNCKINQNELSAFLNFLSAKIIKDK